MNRKEALATLNLDEGADMEEIKKVYRKLAFELHPDLHPDRPEMARRFQLLNDAYMLLSRPGGKEFVGVKQASNDADTEKARAEARKAYAEAKKRFGEGRTYKAGARPSAHSGANTEGAKTTGANSAQKPMTPGADRTKHNAGKPEQRKARTEKKSQTFKTPEQREAFKRTMQDPFARSVFKDIYRQLREEKGRKRIAANLEKTTVGRITSGVVGAVKGWFRRQIDDEQEVFLPAHILRPGHKIRLQIRQGISGDLKTIELALPEDYNPAKPIRLKGLGKKIGSMQGDLYLKIIPQTDKVESGH